MNKRAVSATLSEQFADFIKPVDREKIRHQIVTSLGVVGGIFAIISTLLWMVPDSATTSSTPGNAYVPDATLVSGFARDYVTAYLSAKAGDEPKLARYVTAKNLQLPPTGSEFVDSDVAFVKQTEMTKDGVAIWTATVSGVVNGSTNAKAQRSFYRVSVGVVDSSPRAIGLPLQVAAPGPGVDLVLDYQNQVGVDSALGQTAAGFVSSYLTGGADFPRYVTTDSTVKPIQPAPYAKVDVIKIGADVAGDGADAGSAEVYITVAARTKNYTLTELSYPLTMRTVEGRWQVKSIRDTPLIERNSTAPPDGNSVTSTTPTTTPPPATRG